MHQCSLFPHEEGMRISHFQVIRGERLATMLNICDFNRPLRLGIPLPAQQ